VTRIQEMNMNHFEGEVCELNIDELDAVTGGAGVLDTSSGSRKDALSGWPFSMCHRRRGK
jgi:bacteriocin-like protein